jgi:V8-like Glu-specific endopeptidase
MRWLALWLLLVYPIRLAAGADLWASTQARISEMALASHILRPIDPCEFGNCPPPGEPPNEPTNPIGVWKPKDIVDCSSAMRQFCQDAECVVTSRDPSVAKAYVKYCTRPIEEAGTAGLAAAMSHVVLIRDKASKDVFCSGIMMNKSTLFTARHCFNDELGAVFDADLKRVEVASIGDSTRWLGVDSISAQNWSPTDHRPRYQTDWLAVRLAGEIDVEALDVVQAGAEIKDVQLAVIGYSPFSRSVRWDGGPACRALFVDVGKGCVAHGCQTGGGTSGAPLFAHIDSSWRMLGIHVGVQGYLNDPGGCLAGVKGNEGIAVRQ